VGDGPGVFRRGQPRPNRKGQGPMQHPKRAEFQISPFLGSVFVSSPHSLTPNDQIQHGNTYGEECVFRMSTTPFAFFFTNVSRLARLGSDS